MKTGMKIVTYNIHKGRGIDGRTSIKRIGEVLKEVNADIIALQEIYSGENGNHGQIETLAATLELNAAFGCTRHHKGQPYGNAILTRWPIIQSHDMDLSWAHRERRGCIRVDLKTPRGTLHVFNIHLGTSYFERRHQVRSFLSSKKITDDLSGPRVLVGDFNEWIRGLTTRMLSEKFESLNLELHITKRRTYPGFLPLLHLDHIYFEQPLHIEKAELVRTKLAKVASDHLPLAATFVWETK
jgi:endonuclease/exonuclease/phosphatase family metal-dependent hydrolase